MIIEIKVLYLYIKITILNNQTMKNIVELLETISPTQVFINAFGKRKAKTMFHGNKKNSYVSDDTRYALMFNQETENIFILPYATIDNNWNQIAEQQNPWVTLGFISAYEITEHGWYYVQENLLEKYEDSVCY